MQGLSFFLIVNLRYYRRNCLQRLGISDGNFSGYFINVTVIELADYTQLPKISVFVMNDIYCFSVFRKIFMAFGKNYGDDFKRCILSHTVFEQNCRKKLSN